jgi:hypothetical protein
MFLSLLADRMNLPAGSLAQAATNFDVYCHRALKSTEDIADLPEVCVVLCHIIYKADNATVQADMAELRSAANWFRQQSCLSKYLLSDEERSLQTQELKVLQALEWQVNLPSVETWLVAFCSRFDAATSGVFGSMLACIYQRGILLSKALTQHVDALKFPPRSLALGFLCSGFITTGLLPSNTFRPESLEEAEWETVFTASQRGSGSRCIMDEACQKRIVLYLQLATQASPEEWQSCSWRLASVVCNTLCKAVPPQSCE